MLRFCDIYTKSSRFLACGKTILVWFLGLKVTWRSTWKRSGCYCFTLYYLIRVNFMLTSTLKCNISLRLCFGCVKQPNLTSHCDIPNAILIPSSKWKTVWTQVWKKLSNMDIFVCTRYQMIYLLKHLTNDYYWPYPGCRKWWLRVRPPYSAVLCELFQRVWLSSTFQIHRKMYSNHYERILTSYESYSNHNSLFQLKYALIFSFLAIITLTPEGNFAWN